MRKTSGIHFYALAYPRSVVFAFVCIALVTIVWSQVDSNTLNLGTLQTTQKAPLLGSQGTSPTVIQADQWQGQNLSLGDLLATLPGVQTRRTGGLGSLQSISIRGVAGNRVLICLDGVPLGDGTSSAVNLGSIDLNQLQAVEIWKGHIPARFGGNSLGGVVNLKTRQDSKRQGNLLLGYGSHHTGESSLSISGQIRDSLRWNSILSWRFSENDFQYLDRNGTEYNTQDDRYRTRKNAQYAEWSGTHAWSWVRPQSTWRLLIAHAQESGGIPGKESQQTQVAGFDQQWIHPRIQRLSLSDQSPWRTEFELGARAELNQLHWSNELDGLGFAYGNKDYQEVGSLDLRLEPSFRLFWEASEHYGAEWHLLGGYEQVKPREFPVSPDGWSWSLQRNFMRSALEAFIEPHSWFGFSSAYQIGTTWDRSSGGILRTTYADTLAPDTQFTWRQSVQASMRIAPKKSPVQGNISVGRHYRIPDLTERFSTHLGVLPNPDLKPEQGWNAEAGLATRIQNTTIRTTIFRTQVEQGIIYQHSAGFSKPGNMERTRTLGLEMDVESKPIKALRLNIRGTLQDPLNQSQMSQYQGKMIPGEPQASLSAECHIQPHQKIEVTYKADWNSAVYRDAANQMEIPAQDNHHATLSWMPLQGTKISFTATNLAGGDYQAIHSAYPTPGRQYHATWVQQF